ncbi:MAG: hypothetical protein WC308_02720 [archaeon]
MEKEKKEKMMQAVGIIIVIVMAGSMIAAGIITNEKNAEQEQQTTTPAQIEASTFSYDVNFDAQVLKELNLARFRAFTTEIDVSKMDLAIKKIDGVKTVSNSSMFKPQTSDTNSDEWIYSADITLEKGASLSAVTEKMVQLSFFSSEEGSYLVQKSATIVPPKTALMLHNASLGIDVNFSFEGKAQSAWINASTLPNDMILAGGTIHLQGKILVQTDLRELENKTDVPKNFQQNVELKIVSLSPTISYEGTRKLNSYLDENALKAEITSADINTVPALFSLQNSLEVSVDSNYVISSSDTDAIKLFEGVTSTEVGQGNSISMGFEQEKISSVDSAVKKYFSDKGVSIEITYPTEYVFGEIASSENLSSFENILSSKGFSVSLKQEAGFDLNSLFIDSFGKELPFEKGTFSATLKPGHSIGDDIRLLLTLTVQRDKISGISGEETVSQ